MANLKWRIADLNSRTEHRVRRPKIRNPQFAIRNGEAMNREELEARTKAFAVSVVRFVAALPPGRVTDVLGYQLLKAGTSVGANYREAGRAESRDDFIHKIAIVEKECSESQYWLELLTEVGMGEPAERHALLTEATELLAIFTSSGRTAKRRRK
jgi:four helix bundle protein